MQKFFINLGIRVIFGNAVAALKANKDEVIRWLDGQTKFFLTRYPKEQIVALGVKEEIAGALQDKGEIFVQAIITVLVNIIIAQAETLANKIIDKIKA